MVEITSLFNVSYNQVYSCVKKNDPNGEEALIDKRGSHNNDDEVDVVLSQEWCCKRISYS